MDVAKGLVWGGGGYKAFLPDFRKLYLKFLKQYSIYFKTIWYMLQTV